MIITALFSGSIFLCFKHKFGTKYRGYLIKKIGNLNISTWNLVSYQDHTILIGNRKWIKEKNFIDIPADVEEKMASQEKLGHTALLAAIDGRIFIHFLKFWIYLMELLFRSSRPKVAGNFDEKKKILTSKMYDKFIFLCHFSF